MQRTARTAYNSCIILWDAVFVRVLIFFFKIKNKKLFCSKLDYSGLANFIMLPPPHSNKIVLNQSSVETFKYVKDKNKKKSYEKGLMIGLYTDGLWIVSLVYSPDTSLQVDPSPSQLLHAPVSPVAQLTYNNHVLVTRTNIALAV